MVKRMVYAIRPIPKVKGAYEAKIEYMPGQVKYFVSKNFGWILAEVEKALDNKIPNLSGPMTVVKEESDDR